MLRGQILRADLVVMHGTIYGDFVLPLYTDLTAITSSVNLRFHHDTRVDDSHEVSALPSSRLASTAIGYVTRNEPVAFASWASTGAIGAHSPDHWSRSLTMFVRP